MFFLYNRLLNLVLLYRIYNIIFYLGVGLFILEIIACVYSMGYLYNTDVNNEIKKKFTNNIIYKKIKDYKIL